jgi:PAS domain S-box-containing protein
MDRRKDKNDSQEQSFTGLSALQAAFLRQNEKNFKLLVEDAPHAILVISDDSLIYSNHAAFELFAADDAAVLMGHPASALFHPDDRRTLKDFIKTASVPKAGPLQMEMRAMRPDGAIIYVNLSSAPFNFNGTSGVLVIVDDISRYKKNQHDLAESEKRFRQLFNKMNSGAVIYQAVNDGEDFIIKDINMAVEHIEKVKREDIIGKQLTAIFPGVKDFGLFAILQRVWRTGNAESYPAAHYLDPEREGWRENAIYKLPSGEIITIYNDITDRIKAEEKIAHLASFPELNPSPVAEFSADGKALYANAATMQLFPDLQKLGAKHPYLTEWNNITSQLTASNHVSHIDREITVNGYSYLQTVQYLEPQNIFRVYARDITLLKQAKIEITRLNRLYAVISQINQAVVHASTKEAFLETICNIVTKFGNFKLAWIGKIDPESKSVIPVASAGEAREYADGITIYTDERPEGRGPTGASIRKLKPVIQNDFVNDPNTAPWHKRAEKYGFRGSAAFPILVGGKAWGVLTVYSDVIGFFGPEEVKLLEEAVGDIGFALDNMEHEELRKQAEEALRQSEEKYHQLFTSMTEGFALHEIITDDKGKPFDYRFIEMNPAFVQMTGLKAEDTIGKTSREILPDLDPYWVEIYGQVALTGKSAAFENHSTPLNKWFAVTAYSPEPGRFATIFSDITERKRAEEALKAAEEKYHLIAENMSEMVLLMDMQYKHSYLSPSFERIRGFTLDEYNNLPLEKNLPPDSIRVMQEKFAENFAPERLADKNLPITFGYEIEVYRKDGSTFPVQDTVSLIRNTDGTPSNIMIVSRDMTERKKAEAETQRLRQKAEMSSRLAAVGEMAAGIAHEINNPLTSVIGFSELLMEHKLPPDVMEELKIIADGSHRVADIVKRLLTFARQSKPIRTSVNINSLIDNTIKLRSYVLETANIRVFTCYDEALPWIVADPSQMQQVFLNLIVNAEQAMKTAHNRGELRIVTERHGQKIRIVLTDDGPGITGETMEHLFEPFYTTKGPTEGTGLGLSLSRSIVLEHGGDMWAESEEGQGATFIVELPITEAPAPSTGTDTPASIKETGPTTPARIMVIDDEQSIRDYLQTALTLAGYTVSGSGDPDEALQTLDDSYDVVLLDIRMPGISGIDLYAYILQKVPALDGKVIFITGDASDAEVRDFLKNNNLPFLPKPLELEVLKQKISSVLKPSDSRQSS